MKNSSISFILIVILCICCNVHKKKSDNIIITIETADDLEKHIGQFITIKGEVTNTKIPTIIGVDVSSNSPDLRGELGIASGILEKNVVSEKDIDKYSANRGSGTFYRLKDPDSDTNAQVQKIK